MTRTMIAFVSAVAFVLASATTVLAQGKRGSAPKPQHVSSKGTTTRVSSQKTTKAPKTSGPRTTAAGSQTSKGPKTTTVKATGKTKTTSSPATTTARTDTARTTKTAKADARATTTSDTATPVALTRVQERLQKNTKLAERLEGRLPRGTDLMDAAEGFRNLGQFVAAVNVSNNLRLDFDKLKVAIVDDGKSLGQAIQFVKTDVENPTLVARRAESEAQTLIQQTETTTTTTSRPPQKTKSNDKSKRAGSGS